jgi:hypothetical protein
MDIFNSNALKPTLKIGFAQLRSVHAHRIVPDVEYATNSSGLQVVEYFVGRASLISESKKIGSVYGSRFIPERFAFFAQAL